MMYDIEDILLTEYKNCIYSVKNNCYAGLYWDESNTITKPTEEQIQAKIAELQAAEPLRLLRLERDKLLTETDWRMTKDYPYADQLEWEDYRFELRELPQRIANGEVSAPTLDENGMLVFDEWPLKPGETA